jgi:hypothetical protein
MSIILYDKTNEKKLQLPTSSVHFPRAEVVAVVVGVITVVVDTSEFANRDLLILIKSEVLAMMREVEEVDWQQAYCQQLVEMLYIH